MNYLIIDTITNNVLSEAETLAEAKLIKAIYCSHGTTPDQAAAIEIVDITPMPSDTHGTITTGSVHRNAPSP